MTSVGPVEKISKAPPKNSLNAQRAPCLEREKNLRVLGAPLLERRLN